jgi:hypothetical protein
MIIAHDKHRDLPNVLAPKRIARYMVFEDISARQLLKKVVPEACIFRSRVLEGKFAS